MTTPVGCLRVLTQTLMRLARNGDVDGFSAYVRTDEFLTAFNGLNPGRRQSALRCYGRAEALCEARARHPLAKPGPIDAKRTQKVNWGDPAMRAKLAAAYATAGGDDEKAARILGVSLGAARLAKRRYLDGASTGHHQKAFVAGHGRPSSVEALRVRAVFERPTSRAARRHSTVEKVTVDCAQPKRPKRPEKDRTGDSVMHGKLA